MPDLLNKRCNGSHDHTPCAGPNTLLTQGYTPEIVNIVHQSITQDIARLNKGSGKKHKPDGSFDHDSAVHYKGRSVLNVGIEEMDEAVAKLALA